MMTFLQDLNASRDAQMGNLFFMNMQYPSVGPPSSSPIVVDLHHAGPTRRPPFVWLCGGIILGLIVCYLHTCRSFLLDQESRETAKVPPVSPYWIPYVGHAFNLLFDPAKGFINLSQRLGPRTTHGVKVIGHDIFFVYGTSNIARLRKYPVTITTPGVTTFVLKTLFGMKQRARSMYTDDDSGVHSNPRLGTQVAPHNRIDHLTHVSFHKHLLGEGLNGMYHGFADSFMHRLKSLSVGGHWTHHSDLVDFWLPTMTSAMNDALAGPILECIDPEFTTKMLKYYPYLHKLMKGVPGWWMFEARRLRKELIQDVKIWHAIARAQFKESDVDSVSKRDPWWGSHFMRERQSMLASVDNWDADALASSDFGIFWGSSVNIHPMAIWSVIEIFKDRHLLQRVRTELTEIGFREILDRADVEKLLTVPLLQSIYSELLRLRVQVQSVFSSDQHDIQINEWRVPKGSLVITPAGPAHRDPEVWNTKGNQHPLDSFWADRFLAYPKDPTSGPLKAVRPAIGRSSANETLLAGNKPKFVGSGMTDSFMPYGIGERTCPGRGFARREIITLCALIADRFDIEFVDHNQDWSMSTTFYGIGTQRPRSKIPFRIRTRAR